MNEEPPLNIAPSPVAITDEGGETSSNQTMSTTSKSNNDTPHATTENIPTLNSAPPSGAADLTELLTPPPPPPLRSSVPPQQPQPQQLSSSSSGGPTMASLPPPPRMSAAAAAAASTTTPTPTTTTTSPTIAPLPPPPVRSTKPLLSRPTPDSSSSTQPPPLPPLPRPGIKNQRPEEELERLPSSINDTTSDTSTPVETGSGSGSTNDAVTTNDEQDHEETPVPSPTQQPPRIPTPPPPRLFLSPLAQRQTHIPILVLATESANSLAYKNNLTLSDMLSGLAEDLSSVTRSMPLPPFRSATRSIILEWESLHTTFVDPDFYNPHDPLNANQELFEATTVRDTDGNVAEELNLLESQVDSLLHQEESTTSSSTSGGSPPSSPGRRIHPSGHTSSGSGTSREYESSSTSSDADTALEDVMEANRNRHAQLERVTRDAFALTSPPNLPWLLRVRHSLDETTNGLPHDLIHTPALCLIVCTSQETTETPIECLQELFSSPHYLPLPYAQSTFNMKTLRKEALVLHDNIDGPSDFNESQLTTQLRQTFGIGSAVVRLNSVSPETAHALAQEEAVDEWGGNGDRGGCLSVNDRFVLRRYIATLMTGSLLPSLERRISDLNMTVNVQKKGMKNVFKSLWRAPKEKKVSSSTTTGSSKFSNSGSTTPKNKASSSSSGGTPSSSTSNGTEDLHYRYDSIESQVRLLADTLFLMRDYDAALNTYKLIRDDYKSDHAILHYASIHEMMGLCSYLLDPSGRVKETFAAMETALFSYTRQAEEDRLAGTKPAGRPQTVSISTRLATRLCLVVASTRNMCVDRHLEVADLLASLSSHETALAAAVMLEQSSSHYFRAGMYRKYAFHMLMSGHMFRSAGQEQHAFRCFTSALYVYHDGRWEELHNHLRSALAAQLYSIGRKSTSMQLYAKLVGTTGGGRVSVKSQDKFVHHLLEICQKHPAEALVGADRMMAAGGRRRRLQDRSSTTTTTQTSHEDRLRSIEDVFKRTPTAQRVLELPYMDLPRIDDTSITVCVETEKNEHKSNTTSSSGGEASSSSSSSSSSPWLFGLPGDGDESVWQDMKCDTEAELRGADPNTHINEENMSPAMASSLERIDDILTRKVICEMDKERTNLQMIEKSKRNGKYKAKPPVRARMEPLSVSFVMNNPLGVDVDLKHVQLVATLTDAQSHRTCTTEDAILIGSSTYNDNDDLSSGGKEWTFKSSQLTFQTPHFCRTSPEGADDVGGTLTPWTSPSSSSTTKDGEEEEDPFFVVTKTNMTLEAETETTISLGICPLVRGDLEIVGVRYQLFNDVWSYHKFQPVGPLLNDTRMNRANRARGESTVLQATVGGDMPYLTAHIFPADPAPQVEVSDNEELVLHGQISSWILRLSNIGTAAATNLTLKTNIPWVNISSTTTTETSGGSSSSISDTARVSQCVGPTGTLMELPISGGKRNGIIDTGETVDVPILVRTSGTGKQEFYMLYRYELHDSSSSPSPSASNMSRWIRKMVNVPVYPSLALSASIMPSSWKNDEHILSVEITNQRSDRPVNMEITMDKIGVTSRHYRLERLLGQLGDANDEPKPLKLGWQERLAMHYRVIPRSTETSICTVSDCPFMEGAIHSGSPRASLNNMASTDYLCLEHAHTKFQSSLKAHQNEMLQITADEDDERRHPRSISQIRRAKSSMSGVTDSEGANSDGIGSAISDSMPSVHPTSLASVCPTETSASAINIVCSWSAVGGGSVQDRVVHGQHHLTHVRVRPQMKTKTCPITLTANHPACVSHDFTHGPASVPIEIVIRNRVVAESIHFDFELDRSGSIEFTGAECFTWTLEGGDEISVAVQAFIASPGVYDLQNVRITVDDEDGTRTPYVFPLQWMVTVKDLR